MKAEFVSLKNTLVAHRYAMAAWSIALLAVQNIIVFWQHYTGSAIFLNDFTRNIYPMIAFWTTLVQHGVFPEWTPFQTMGMPFVLTMQSGVFYPPLWLFAFVKVPFTLHIAAVVQVLHVLWGAIGCLMYMRLLGRSHGAALFAAIAFQFFGGFYSNAEHIDIIRAFSYIPWLFWVVHILPQQTRLSGRNWLTPLIIMFSVTGSYQGNLVSHLFMLGVFWLFSCVSIFVYPGNNVRCRFVLYLQVAALILLGIGLCAVYLLPTIALKSYLARDGVWSGHVMNWPLHYWNSLIMASNAEGLYVLPSMLSAFITVPVFCLLFLISPAFIKQNALWVGITVFALVMASGPDLPVYPWLVNIFPPLGSSRFASSDYRGILCFGLILLSSGILDDYIHGKWKQPLTGRAVLCVGLLLFFYLTNLFATWLSSSAATHVVAFVKSEKILVDMLWLVLTFASSNIISAEISEWPIVMGLSVLCFLTLYGLGKQPKKMLLILIVLELISGLYFVNRLSLYWRSDVTTDSFYQELNAASPYAVMKAINHPIDVRPACHDMNLFSGSWRGYLLGDFMCQTQDSKTRPREIVNTHPALDAYMRQPWQPRLVSREQLADCQPDNVPQANSSLVPVQSVSYSVQNITYQVHALSEFCFIENELMFPGWSGVLTGSLQPVQPQAYCGALRSWCLPEGDYQLMARYRTPWLREGVVLSLLFWVFYIVLYICWLRLNRKAVAV